MLDRDGSRRSSRKAARSTSLRSTNWRSRERERSRRNLAASANRVRPNCPLGRPFIQRPRAARLVGRVAPLILRSPTLRSPSVSKNRSIVLRRCSASKAFDCGVASLRQLHATARRESHRDVDRRACWLLSGRPLPINFSFHGFLAKADGLQEMLAAHAVRCA